jgi:Raf kinase inhibitor-like YbhB/YbcL family protein
MDCEPDSSAGRCRGDKEPNMPLTLSSPAFVEGGSIPDRFTRDGENVSPPLRWGGVPDGTKSLVRVMEDTDAPSGSFGHWAVFNIPPDVGELPEAAAGKPGPKALRQAKNDFGNAYYDGPAPPSGSGAHEYHFRLAALDVPNLSLPGQVGVRQLWQEARKHAIEETELVAVCARHG